MFDYQGEKLDETQAYLKTHHILEIVQSLTSSLLVDRPDNPRKYLEKNLQLLRSIKTRNQNHVLFTRENLMGLFRFFDHVGRGYISMAQYSTAMDTVGAIKFSLKPNGYGLDRITMDTFTEEAYNSSNDSLIALRKLSN